MKESISYSFLLNIVLVFIFVGFAIVMGTLSYYKAFRANSIISETIEKYEGYNCASKEEISRKLNTISYKAPFNVACNANDGNCAADNNNGYKIISYNLDFDKLKTKSRLLYDDSMNSSYICDGNNGCTTNKHYQYGIYTYMYVDFPVISKLLKLTYFSKTSIMYEFRNYYAENITQSVMGETYSNTRLTEVESFFDGLYSKGKYQGSNNELKGKEFVTDNIKKFGGVGSGTEHSNTALDTLINNFNSYYMEASTGNVQNLEVIFQFLTGSGMPDYRQRLMIDLLVKGTGGGNTGGIGTTLKTYGKDGVQRNKTCTSKQYKIDFGSINY